MNMPGFTAETSLYNGNVRYQSTTEATIYGGLVQPAGSEVFDPGGSSVPFLSTQLIFRDRRVSCLRWTCLDWVPEQPWKCRRWVRSVGVLKGGVCV